MRTYKEYYDIAKKHQDKWYRMQKEEWWRKDDEWTHRNLSPKGDYIETVKFLTEDEKNDVSAIANNTNVKNSQMDLLDFMLGQALIDWCNENGQTDIWSYSIKVRRYVDGLDDVLECSHSLKGITKNDGWFRIEDEEKLKKFDDCDGVLCDIMYDFISRLGKDIPCDWNYFSFGLDSLDISCEYGFWTPASDGSMNLGCLDDEGNYDEFLESL